MHAIALTPRRRTQTHEHVRDVSHSYRVQAQRDADKAEEIATAEATRAQHLAEAIAEKKGSYSAVEFEGGDLRDPKNMRLFKSPRGLDASVLRGWLTRPSKVRRSLCGFG